MSEHWRLIIDVALCENCGNCQLAAKDEYVGNDFPGYSAPHPLRGAETFRIERFVRGEGSQIDVAYVPRMCNHCADAPCIKAAPDVIRRREDGIVLIDPKRAHGRSDLVAACPYGAIGWNAELQLPQNWIFDAHLIDLGWKQPRCEQVCPTGAIASAKLDDEGFARVKREQGLEDWSPGLNTRPNVVYKNLHRAKSRAIFGSIVKEDQGVQDCAAGARVRLLRDGAALREQVSDDFGDFKFDGLEPGGGPYQMTVEHESGRAKVEIGELAASVALGIIQLR
ncbi:oxidoreductase [Rhodoblastus sphagnicola]|uniref:Oxidoreductase n=1 Tax=Rhodoblastus sphagnicola TaxID=333368 RepID=A0A2S6N431_9HYPH|nr:4Fe-4S dicluster domain-containing protein [Rhodoblastus sphagnicola]MBB4199851.1 Fe-S-cluster-containing dehydrogenase component [Rhodoblastus sphagnicola]PPQ29370.1 oxidoreductase [Rhodoblastus sphagnicola]